MEHEKYANMIESIFDVAFLIDCNGKIEAVNTWF